MHDPQRHQSEALQEPIFFIDNATTTRRTGEVAFRDLNWTVREGETWAVVGPTASGKTTLADVLLGQCRIDRGTIGWPLLERLRASGANVVWPAEVIHYMGFREESRLFSHRRHYYQERFNFSDPREEVLLEDFLKAGASTDSDHLIQVAKQWGINLLLHQSVLKLSNGEMRRARIARQLLTRPAWLVLDEPFLGLDSEGQAKIAAMLADVIHQGTRILLLGRPDHIPECVTHVLELDRLAVRWQGPREQFVNRHACEAGDYVRPDVSKPPGIAEPIIELRGVNVRYDERLILQDVSWTVRRGERWAVLGPNGSGKSTLLSLICADHPQVYSNDIRLFGQPRGSGESIWDIKRQIGLVSPELHLCFSEPLSAAQTVATGFFDVVTARPTTPEQDRKVCNLLEQFKIAALARRPFASLSTGEQRLVLLIRALVKTPALLVLDEPFQGLDGHLMKLARQWLDDWLKPEQTLIFVTHYPREIPQSVHGVLQLDSGHVVAARRD